VLALVTDADPSRKPGTPSRVAGGTDDVGPVLDALGGMLSSFGRHAFDMPNRPATEVSAEFSRWHRHATTGVPAAPAGTAPAVGIRERDWDGVLRAFSEQRREESRYVEAAVSELRDALWSCVETVHNAVKIDQQADVSTEAQMLRARAAVGCLQAGDIKQEALDAVAAIQEALRERRDQQDLQYVSLAKKLDGLGRQLEDARREITTDALTGLGNRKLFDSSAQRAVQIHALGRRPVTLIMVDLNKLKTVNDMYGHQAGDAFIVGVARAMSKVFLRDSDIICRHGGDEFSVILHNTECSVGLKLAQRLHEQIALIPKPHPALELPVSASVGLAQLRFTENVTEWIARGDKAMYVAKHGEGTAAV
jgi:diguanylate cyclase (GGDEF)-like protein